MKLGSCTTQKILSVLDRVVKVSNINWSAYLQAKCTYRCRADGIIGRCAATDVCFMLHIYALSEVLQSRQHHQSQCSNQCQLCAAQSCVKPSAAEQVVPSVTAALHLFSAGLRSIEQTVSLLLYFQVLSQFLITFINNAVCFGFSCITSSGIEDV